MSEKSLLAEREKKRMWGQTAHETPAEVGGCKHMRLPFDGLLLLPTTTLNAPHAFHSAGSELHHKP